jgi:hypothetical protein
MGRLRLGIGEPIADKDSSSWILLALEVSIVILIKFWECLELESHLDLIQDRLCFVVLLNW